MTDTVLLYEFTEIVEIGESGDFDEGAIVRCPVARTTVACDDDGIYHISCDGSAYQTEDAPEVILLSAPDDNHVYCSHMHAGDCADADEPGVN